MEFKKEVSLLEIKDISKSLYLLSIEKSDIKFTTGQHITLSMKGENNSRVYSIASGETDDRLELLIREIDNGDMSKRFRKLKNNSTLEISSPVGYFCLPENFETKKIYCIATGSGIAPFRSFAKTHQHYPFTIIHGIRNIEDSLFNDLNTVTNYITCTSRSDEGDFQGRVTDYIKNQNLDNGAYYYLCGNGEMIHELYRFLINNKIPRENLFYEEYFNN